MVVIAGVFWQKRARHSVGRCLESGDVTLCGPIPNIERRGAEACSHPC